MLHSEFFMRDSGQTNFILRILYRFYRLFSWVDFWAARRFTRAGIAVVAGVCVAATLAMDPENTVGYQGMTLLLGMLLVALVFRVGFRASFAVERLLPRFGTVGQPFTYRVSVRNLTPSNQLGLTLLGKLTAPPNCHAVESLQA